MRLHFSKSPRPHVSGSVGKRIRQGMTRKMQASLQRSLIRSSNALQAAMKTGRKMLVLVAVTGNKSGSGLVMEESENDVGGLEKLLLYADEHYLAGKLPLGNNLAKVLHEVEEYHQRNVGPLITIKVDRLS
ncbi:hypothetical protein TNCV_1910601 [Trichonephila clavipes]|nr:hypothetical protein TNCV_1910601 [Trichonephila clavipes]